MSFFPPEPETPAPKTTDRPAVPIWHEPPADELPGWFGCASVLVAEPHLALALAGIRVYRDGIELTIEHRARRGALDLEEWQRFSRRVSPVPNRPGAQMPGRLQYGVVLADGRAVIEQSPYGVGRDPFLPADGPTLVRLFGGSTGDVRVRRGADRLWLCPLPPPGALELVLQWPDVGIPETRVLLDATRIRDHAEHARPFWTE